MTLKLESEDCPEYSNIKTLNHINLDRNPEFLELKGYLIKYYNERTKPIHKQTLHKDKTQKWKEKLYNSLQSLLRELTYTHSPGLQLQTLSQIHTWYKSKCRKETKFPQLVSPQSPAESDQPSFFEKSSRTPDPIRVPIAYIPGNQKISLGKAKSRFNQPRNHETIGLSTTKARLLHNHSRKKKREFKDNALSKSLKTSPKHSTFMRSDFIEPIKQGSGFLSTVKQKTFVISSPMKDNSEFEEVIRAKNRLAKKNINIPFERLESGLILPKINFSNTPNARNFPKGGEQLFPSSYFKCTKD